MRSDAQKNCNPSKSHFCRSPNGAGACVPLIKQCKYVPEGAVKQASDYVAKQVQQQAKPKEPDKTKEQQQVKPASKKSFLSPSSSKTGSTQSKKQTQSKASGGNQNQSPPSNLSGPPTAQEREDYNKRIQSVKGDRSKSHERYLKEAKEAFPTPPPHPVISM